MLGQLIPCSGGDPIPLKTPVLMVGRSRKCDIPVRARSVSSQHCVLEHRDGRWFARDIGSHNGIRIDGNSCQAGELSPDSVLCVGDQHFVVRYELKEQTAAADASPPSKNDKSRAPTRPAAPPPRPVAEPSIVRLSTAGRSQRVQNSPKMFLGKLTPCGGGDPIPLMSSQLLVGRRSSCDIIVASKRVSSKHCELLFREGYWFVQDLESRNGVKVDDIEYDSTVIRPGQILSVAGTRFELDYVPRSDEPPPEDINPFARGLLEKAGLARAVEAEVAPKWLKSDQDIEPDERIELDID